jgi:ribosomal protein S18 acetylase RimI-like enzyme
VSEGPPVVGLRPAQADDRDFFAAVYASTRTEELAPVPWSAEQKAAFLEQQFAAQSAHYAQHRAAATTDVILVDGEPAGRLMVLRSEHDTLIVDIALLPPYRRLGIGTRLLEPIIEETSERGATLTIHVERMNTALRLYRRLGFEAVGDDGVYLTMRRHPRQASSNEALTID